MLESDLQWTEVLICPRCGKTGVAQLAAGDSPFEDHADLVPYGFELKRVGSGAVKFCCVTCKIPAKP